MWPLGREYCYQRGDLRCRRYRRLVLFEWHKCDFVKIVVTGCTRSSHFDNSWSSQWQKVHKCYDIFISVKLNVNVVIYENYEDILQCCLSHCPLGERKFWWVIFKLIFLQIDDRSFLVNRPLMNKNIVRHTAHTIVSWPNPKQWLMIHTSGLMMIIR